MSSPDFDHNASQPTGSEAFGTSEVNMTMMPIVRITEETTREELAETLAHLVEGAKAIGRRGYCGIRSAEYARQHARIDAVLADLLAHQ